MRLEQRIGRIHRIGQKRDVFVFNLCVAGTVEDYMMKILDEKIHMFELVIGEIESIIGNMDSDREFGCLVEVRDPRCAQVLFPPELRERLAVGEMETLCFDGAETEGGIGIHYGSDFLKKLAPLVAERGRFTVRIEETRAVFPRDPERVLAHNLALQNGIYRFKDLSVRWFSYLVVNFRVAALADTKSEALIAAVINEEAKTIPEGMEALLVRRFPGEKAGPGLTRSLERFACEKCFRSLTSVFLSDAMDVLCPSCQERQK